VPKLDLHETALVAGLLAIASFVLGYEVNARVNPSLASGAEVQWLARTYGPAKNSQYVEEWVVRDFFKDRRAGTFVDVGAADYREYSNTYFLETQLDWSGLAIEPQASFAPGFAANRPRTKFFPLFASDVSNDTVKVFLNEVPWVASSDPAFTRRWGTVLKTLESRTITLNDLLSQQGVQQFDFLSMDIELAEPKALAGFDIERFKPALVCIEAHPEVRQQLLDYFAAHRYTIAGKYLRVDDRNLYFVPAGTVLPNYPARVLEAWTH
jgi:FkbM family methyltransferase